MAHCSRSGIMPPSASLVATDPTPHIEDYLVLLLVKASFLDPHARSLTREARIPGFNQGIRHEVDRKSTRLNSSHQIISYAVFCLKKKKKNKNTHTKYTRLV